MNDQTMVVDTAINAKILLTDGYWNKPEEDVKRLVLHVLDGGSVRIVGIDLNREARIRLIQMLVESL